MTHGHEVLHMMEGHKYESKEQLIEAIIKTFGAEERFYTCSSTNMSASELVDFLIKRRKFTPLDDRTFTVDTTKICNN